MREEVLSHFASGETPEIACFLLREYVPHTRAIGYEVLVGFREGPAFGLLLTASRFAAVHLGAILVEPRKGPRKKRRFCKTRRK